jgi:hypothetical protein
MKKGYLTICKVILLGALGMFGFNAIAEGTVTPPADVKKEEKKDETKKEEKKDEAKK